MFFHYFKLDNILFDDIVYKLHYFKLQYQLKMDLSALVDTSSSGGSSEIKGINKKFIPS